MKKAIFVFPLSLKMVFLFVVLFTSVQLLQAQIINTTQRTISATGRAKIEVVPDEIYVQVNLREYDKKGGGKIDIETIKNNFLAACKSLGFRDTDVVVQGFQGYDGTIYQYKKNKKQNPDLKTGITYWVKVNSLKRMDELVSKLDDEATQNFFIAKTDYSKREEMALQMKADAIKAAKQKAVYLAAAINQKIGDAITLSEPNEIGDVPRPMYSMAMYKTMDAELGAEPPMNVDFKKLKIEYEANVVFALL